MLIKESSLEHWIDRFYGYGSWNSKLWLVGYEEGGGELPEEVAEKLGYFDSIHPRADEPVLCDMRELYARVTYRDEGPKGKTYKTLFDYRFASDAMLHGAWKNLIGFAHGYRQEKLPDLLAYQRKTFIGDREAMIQLYPLPSPHSHAWYYSWHTVSEPLQYIRQRERYEQHVFPSRMGTILKQIKRYKPGLVLMYGMSNVQAIKDAFVEAYPSAKFRMVKAIKLQLPQHHAAVIDGTRVVITTQVPTLRHNRVETGFDWHYFGSLVKDYV
jgi:hypothetical protein